MSFDVDSVMTILPLLLQGLQVTIIASVGAVIVAIAVGLLIAIVRRSAAPTVPGAGAPTHPVTKANAMTTTRFAIVPPVHTS